mgnify:CR=1 FL=1|jgi:hypothetical protein
MTEKDKGQKRIHDEEVILRSKINTLLGNFARKNGLKAVGIAIEDNQWYKGSKEVPMFVIDIAYKPTYMA